MDPDRPRRFCDIEMSYTDYDHYRAIRAYVWTHLKHLLTPLERRVTEYNVPITNNPEHDKSRRIHTLMESRDGHVEDADVVKACKKPREQLIDDALDRVLAEYGDKLPINCCPECSRVLRTPLAQQCLWCGHDWHEAKKA